MIKATIDKLQRMLDECGVKYRTHFWNISWIGNDGVIHMATIQSDGKLVVDMLTPEQAIAATLWRCPHCGRSVSGEEV